MQMISFSPSGSSIAILVDKFQKMLIAEVEEEAIRVTKQVPQDFSYVSGSVWLDESRILFVGEQASTRQELWELNIKDGSVKKRGIPGLWMRDSLTLSPDKTSVVVCGVADGTEKDTRWNLWKYSLASSKLVKISNGTEDVSPNWRR